MPPRHSQFQQLRRVQRSHRVVFPTTGMTLAQVEAYYATAAPCLLPQLLGRPVLVRRFPDGVDGPALSENRWPNGAPTWVRSIPVASALFGRIGYIAIDGRAAMDWCLERDALEFHAYPFRGAADVGEPVPLHAVFELEPGPPAGLAAAVEAAARLRSLLAALDLECLLTTGPGETVQLTVPLTAVRGGFARVRGFARHIARLLAERHPEHITAVTTRRTREGRVAIDWSGNDHQHALLAPYSLIAGTQPRVATPLAWDEVDLARREGRSGHLRYGPGDALARIGLGLDPTAALRGLRQELPDELEALCTSV